MSEWVKNLAKWYATASKDEVLERMNKHFELLRQQRDAYRDLAINYRQHYVECCPDARSTVDCSAKIIDNLVARTCKFHRNDTITIVLPPPTPLKVLDEISPDRRRWCLSDADDSAYDILDMYK